MAKPSTNPAKVAEALRALLARMESEDAEFPDACWSVASAHNVEYEALADAYDDHCRDK